MTPEQIERTREQNREYMRRRRQDPAFKDQEREYSRDYEATKRQRPDGFYDPGGAFSEQQKAYRKANPEVGRRAAAKWRARNPELAKQRLREYRATERGREVNRQNSKAYRARNPELARFYVWRKKGAPVTEREYPAVLLRDPCSYCGGPAGEVDHVTPVSRGGTSDWGNLTAACPICNRSKGNKPLLLWLLSRQAG